MITVEDLLMAYASAYDAWLDPETERKNPTPEYAELIRQAVSFENAKLRELSVLNWEWAHSCCANSCKMQTDGCGYGIDRECNYEREIADLMRDLGIEVNE